MNKLFALLTLTIPAGWMLGGCVDTINVDEGRSLVLKADKRVVVTKENREPMPPPPANAPASKDPAGEQQLASLSGDIPPQRTESDKQSQTGPDTSGSFVSRFICAEPSPDAISVWAASGGASVAINGQGGSIFGGRSQSAAPLGLRTGATQILRDLEYRACEGLMNGVIGEQDYDKLMRGLPAVTLGLVAIEGLTNTQAASSVSIHASAPSNSTNFTSTKEQSKNGKQEKGNTGTSSGVSKPPPAKEAGEKAPEATAAGQTTKSETKTSTTIGGSDEREADSSTKPAPTGDKAASPVSKDVASAVVQIFCLSAGLSVNGSDLESITTIIDSCKKS